MNDGISPSEFHAADGTEDWRVLGEGACAFFPTGSLAAGARFVQAIGELPGIEDHSPDIDLRCDGVTVRLITIADDWFGPSRRDVEQARRISAVAREQGLTADPSAVQTLLVIPGAPVTAEVLTFWRAVLGYEPRADSPEEDLVDPGVAAGRSGSKAWTSRARVAGRSMSPSGSRTSWPRPASRRRSQPGASSSATTTPRRGGPWRMPPATRPHRHDEGPGLRGPRRGTPTRRRGEVSPGLRDRLVCRPGRHR